jgi:hypothetical protein
MKMHKSKITTIRSVAVASMLLGLTLPLASVKAQEVSTDLANAAKDACVRSAESKGFQLKDVVSISPKGVDGADVILNLDRGGQLYKLTCGYTPGSGAVFGDDTTGGTIAAPNLTPLWWLLVPLIGLPLLLWWARGRDTVTAAAAPKRYVGRSEAIVRRPGGTLDIRSGPGITYRVTDTLQDGQRVTLSGRSDEDWTELAEGGWVSTQYLEKIPHYVG